MEQIGVERWIDNENTNKSACEWGSIPMKMNETTTLRSNHNEFKTMGQKLVIQLSGQFNADTGGQESLKRKPHIKI